MQAAGVLLVLAVLYTAVAHGAAPPPLMALSMPPLLPAPGSIPPERTPQFVLLTHDDGVSSSSRDMLRAVTDGRTSPNGCPLTATLFAKVGNTNCKALAELYELGYEVADHTVNHKRLYGEDRAFVESEVLDARAQLAACGVPERDIVGFRAPFLDIDRGLRDVLHSAGFLYDSSLVEDTLGGSLSAGFANRSWPFDAGAGIPITCSDWNGPYGTHRQACEPGELHPGLWEVPVWRMGEMDKVSHMDPGFDYTCMCHASQHSALEFMKAHFDASYAGNRAPFPLYIHPFWLRFGDNLKELQEFVDYALSLPDVHFVTMRQLIAWMKNPVPADQLTQQMLGCGSPGGAPGTLADAQAPAPQSSSAQRRRRRLGA